MPVVYKCANCGSTIYTFLRAGQDYYGVPSLSELKVKIGNRCPKCGKELRNNIDLNAIIISVKR